MGLKRILHLVYPSGPGIGCPQTIGRHLAAHLSKRFDVRQHAWDSPALLEPTPGAILLGHAHPSPWTVFRRSAKRPGWDKVVMLCPYNGEPKQVAWLDPVVATAERYLAITGPYWAKRLKSSPFAHWAPKFQALDLAVDRKDFPRIKKRFNAAGKRRFLYIGHAGWPKNTALLSRLAKARPDWDFAWMGGTSGIPGVKALGRKDFATRTAQAEVASYDFMITLGTADANPSTILEAMAWGLVPVCSPQSGYEGEEGIVNVPIEDDARALAALDALQSAPDARLKAWVRKNDQRLRSRFEWSRFGKEVEAALLAPKKALPAQRAEGAARLQALHGPNSPLRPRWALKALRDRWRQG